MPNTREKLNSLIHEAEMLADKRCDNYPNCDNCPADNQRIDCMEWLEADCLLSLGVTVQEWISVKDRLPEVATTHNTRWDKSTDSIHVLCACVQADGKKMVKEGYCKVYSDGYVHWKIPGTIHSVTHWAYSPQPPKGE